MISQPKTRAEWFAAALINQSTADEMRRTALRDAFDERVAICAETMSDERAERIATDEIKARTNHGRSI